MVQFKITQLNLIYPIPSKINTQLVCIKLEDLFIFLKKEMYKGKYIYTYQSVYTCFNYY